MGDLIERPNESNARCETSIDMNTPIPFFRVIAEEMRIVAEVERRLSVVEELEAAVSANPLRATRLRQAILQGAFSKPENS